MNWCMMNPGQFDKVAEVQRKVDDVKNVMVQNIEQVLARGERIEDLVDKTDQLRFQAEVSGGGRWGEACRTFPWVAGELRAAAAKGVALPVSPRRLSRSRAERCGGTWHGKT